MNDMPYGFTSNTWPGLSKLVEECGEVLELLGKIMGAGGSLDHRWKCEPCRGSGNYIRMIEGEVAESRNCDECDGRGYMGSGDLTDAIHEELGDLMAAVTFMAKNTEEIDAFRVWERATQKSATFERWRREGVF